MAGEDELYVSIDEGIYRRGKSELLMCQAGTLTLLKKLYNLKVLARQKNDLKKMLAKLFVSINSDIKSIQDKFPTTSLPKTIPKTKSLKSKAKTDSKRNDIETELRIIQEKLAKLNS